MRGNTSRATGSIWTTFRIAEFASLRRIGSHRAAVPRVHAGGIGWLAGSVGRRWRGRFAKPRRLLVAMMASGDAGSAGRLRHAQARRNRRRGQCMTC